MIDVIYKSWFFGNSHGYEWQAKALRIDRATITYATVDYDAGPAVFYSQLAQVAAHRGAVTAASTVHHQNLALSWFAESFPARDWIQLSSSYRGSVRNSTKSSEVDMPSKICAAFT